MSKDELLKILRECLSVWYAPISQNGLTFRVELDGMDISYDDLSKLSSRLGTTKINLAYSEGCHGYSEYTPGYPGSLTLEVTVNPS